MEEGRNPGSRNQTRYSKLSTPFTLAPSSRSSCLSSPYNNGFVYKLEISLTMQMSCFISSVFCCNKRCLRPAYYGYPVNIRTLSTVPSAFVLKGFNRNDVSWVCLVCMSSTCPLETHAHYVKSINLVHDKYYYQ